MQHLQQLWILTCFHFTHYFLHLANTFILKKRNSNNNYFCIILNEKLSIFEILFSPLLVFFSTIACGSTSLYFQPPHQSSSSFYQRGANVNAAILVIDLVFIPPISTCFWFLRIRFFYTLWKKVDFSLISYKKEPCYPRSGHFSSHVASFLSRFAW